MSARAVFFSEARGEGDRAREKRVKSALRGAREIERMRVLPSRWEENERGTFHRGRETAACRHAR